MNTVGCRKLVLFFGALSASFAALAAEAAAQPRSAPERPLSDAVSEALRSPFHSDHALSGLHGQGRSPLSNGRSRGLGHYRVPGDHHDEAHVDFGVILPYSRALASGGDVKR